MAVKIIRKISNFRDADKFFENSHKLWSKHRSDSVIIARVPPGGSFLPAISDLPCASGLKKCPRTKPFIWRFVSIAWKWTCGENTYSHKWFPRQKATVVQSCKNTGFFQVPRIIIQLFHFQKTFNKLKTKQRKPSLHNVVNSHRENYCKNIASLYHVWQGQWKAGMVLSAVIWTAAILFPKYRRHTDPNGRYDQTWIKRNNGLKYFKQNCPIFRFAIQTFLRGWVEKNMWKMKTLQ